MIRAHKPTPKSVREDLGLSQAQLAALIGVHDQTVSKWERGILEPTSYQQALLHALRAGHRKAPRMIVADWLKTNGPLATLAMLLATAYDLGPLTKWVKV